jgi:hypothetical protein
LRPAFHPPPASSGWPPWRVPGLALPVCDFSRTHARPGRRPNLLTLRRWPLR